MIFKNSTMCRKINSDFIRQLLALLPVLVNVFFCQSHLHWIRNETDNLPNNYQSVAFFSFEIGILLYSLPSGMVLDRYGSKKIILVVGCINFLTWTLLIFTGTATLTPICFTSIVSAIGYALNYCACATVLGELPSPKLRGIYASLIASSGLAGRAAPHIINRICGGWTPSATGVLAAALSLVFIPTSWFRLESPYFLARTGYHEKARQNLKILYPQHSSCQIEETLDRIEMLIESESRLNDVLGFWQFITRKRLVTILFDVCLVHSLVTLLDVHRMFEEAVRFLRNDAIDGYTMCTVYILPFVPLGTALCMEHFSRRILFSVSSLGTVVACVVTLGLIYYRTLHSHWRCWRWMAVASAAAPICVQAALLIPLCDLMAAEFFPIRVKGAAVACVLFTRYVFTILSRLLVSYDMHTNGACTGDNAHRCYATFYWYAIASFMVALVVRIHLPSSRGRSLVDLQCQVGLMDHQRTQVRMSPS